MCVCVYVGAGRITKISFYEGWRDNCHLILFKELVHTRAPWNKARQQKIKSIFSAHTWHWRTTFKVSGFFFFCVCPLCEWVGGYTYFPAALSQTYGRARTHQQHFSRTAQVFDCCVSLRWCQWVGGKVFGCCKQGHLIALCACMSIRRVVHIHIFIFLAFSFFGRARGRPWQFVVCLCQGSTAAQPLISFAAKRQTPTESKQTRNRTHRPTGTHTHTRAWPWHRRNVVKKNCCILWRACSRPPPGWRSCWWQVGGFVWIKCNQIEGKLSYVNGLQWGMLFEGPWTATGVGETFAVACCKSPKKVYIYFIVIMTVSGHMKSS